MIYLLVVCSGKHVIILGEVGKMLPLSPVRITAISSSTNDLQLTLRGQPGETLQIAMCDAENTKSCWKYSCMISGSGQALLSVASATCK